MIHFLLLVTCFLIPALGAYLENGHNNALYWGNGGNQKSLGYYCESGAADIMIISFLNNWNKDSASYNFGNACDAYPATCPQIESDIKLCQSLGIKVLLSLGGDRRLGKYGLSGAADGEGLAQVVYDMFHPQGKGSVKPFGKAEVDGFDFDIENGNDKGLGKAVVKLRSMWTTKKILFTAAPQCPYPDKNVHNLLLDKDAKLDIAFVMYYNNGCKLGNPKNFNENWETWTDFVAHDSGNPNMKLYIGLAAQTDFKDADYIQKTSEKARKSKAFGGFFLWDAVTSFAITDKNGYNYAYAIKNIIRPEATMTSTIVSTSTLTSLSTTKWKTTGTTTISEVQVSTFKGKTAVTLTLASEVIEKGLTVTLLFASTGQTKTTKLITSTFQTTLTGKYVATSYSTTLLPETTTSTLTYLSELKRQEQETMTLLSTQVNEGVTKIYTIVSTKALRK